jgi:hypothetical protein
MPLEASLFVTFTFEILCVAPELTVSFGTAPAPVEFITIGLADVPVRVRLFVIVCVVPDVKVKVFPAVTDVRLQKVVEPEMVEVLVVSKVTVFEPGVKIPPECAQLPDIVKLPEGAVSVPEDKIKSPFTSTAPVEPVKMPPEIVKPPLKVWVAVEAE